MKKFNLMLCAAAMLAAAPIFAEEPLEGPDLGPDLGPELTPGEVNTPESAPLPSAEPGPAIVPGTGFEPAAEAAPAAEPAADAAPSQEPTPMNWFNKIDYDGYEFEVPAGCSVTKGPKLLVKSNDGTFGVSMTSKDDYIDQKVALETCKRLAYYNRLEKPFFAKANFGKAKGAKATGISDGMLVTIVVLPGDGRETTVVMLADPSRKDWSDRFISSLKK